MRLARLVGVSRMKFIDIGANLTDPMYSGDYNGTNRHPSDLASVLDRAESAGLVKMMVTGGSLEESRQVPPGRDILPETVSLSGISHLTH